MTVEHRIGEGVLELTERVMVFEEGAQYRGAFDRGMLLERSRELLGDQDMYYINMLVDHLRQVEETFVPRNSVRAVNPAQWQGGQYGS